jgi:two-component system KDP operon response regulator KdpE
MRQEPEPPAGWTPETGSPPEQTPAGVEKNITGKLLIVDDESAIRWALRKTLQGMGFEIAEAETGEQAIALVRTVRFDAVLLDIGMPGMNGIDACREIRKRAPLLGIVMLSVKNTEEDKIQALDAGADDYITKPFHVRELAARLRAAVRRARSSEADDAAAISIGDIELDPARRVVKRSGEPIHLTPKEFEMLHFLMSHAGLPLTHARILAAVWGPEYRGELEYLRTFVRQLRKKLGDDAASPRYLLTDSQVGYRFRAQVDLTAGGRA